jgi:hypothetical protein
MAQYLLAPYYADRKISAEEFQRLCVDVPAPSPRTRPSRPSSMRSMLWSLAPGDSARDGGKTAR